jgi:hypothetical protein
MTLAHDIGLARLPLSIERIEFLLEALVGRFAGVDRAADTMTQGTRTDMNLGQNCPMSNEAAAKALNVSPRTVKTAEAVKEADPALAEEVNQGKTKLSTAAKKTAALKAIIEAIKTQLGAMATGA